MRSLRLGGNGTLLVVWLGFRRTYSTFGRVGGGGATMGDQNVRVDPGRLAPAFQVGGGTRVGRLA